MNFNYLQNILFLLFSIFLVSCGSDDSEPANLSDSKIITGFSVAGKDATINTANKTILLTLIDSDFTTLVPTITLSEKATVSPASGISQDFTNPVIYTVTAEDGTTAEYQVTISNGIVSFTHNGKNYEIVKDNQNWVDAAAFAVSRGGFLAEINDINEQNAVFDKLKTTIVASNTVAPDGGGASYVWIGGNDMDTEGKWMWDGNNDQVGNQFWSGTQSGTSVDNRFNNWGNEPDDFGSGQDALGLAITDWPLGVAGQWNDVRDNNKLYFLIEFN